MWLKRRTTDREAVGSQPLPTHAAVWLAASYPGLSGQEAERRLRQYGPNEIVKSRPHSALTDFLLRFKNPLIGILVFAAALSAYFGDAMDAFIIVAMIVSSVVLDFVNTYRSERAAEALKARVMITATLVRDGSVREVPLAAIVPGDTVLLAPGDVVPADGRVLAEKDLFINESALTGESFPVAKSVGDQLSMGSSTVTGSGVMEVTATGRATTFSHIAAAVTSARAQTDFDRGIHDFSLLIMRAIILLALFVFFVNAVLKHSLLDSFLFALALSVGLTPELLPMIIALNLSKGSLALSRHGIIVKRLSAIQNFGSMDVLCTDKTGTLTEDRITLVKYVDGFGKPAEDVFQHAYLSSVFETGLVNPLDEAVRAFRTIDVAAYAKVDEIPFDFTRKRSAVVLEFQGRKLLIAKGAPEELFAVCRYYRRPQSDLHGETLERVQAEYRRLSQDGFRVLAVAVRSVAERTAAYTPADERDLVFLGFVAFLDPPKRTVSETLRLLERYGLEIKVITGDNELVTQKIAQEINLPVRGVLLGPDLEHLTDEDLSRRVESATIFARVTPDQKLRIIRTLQRLGRVVGYLGDGVNDAPSLRAADVGISVNNAVDVAKESADLILLRKSLQALINGVVEGRRTFANTLKYLMMTLSSNFGNMFSMAGASLFLPYLPMLPTQILFNNLLYDSSQFAIPLDQVDHRDIERPRTMDIRFIRKFMLVFGPVSSLFDLVTFLALFVVFRAGESAFQTGWFIESLATQTLVIYVIRTRRLPFLESRPAASLVLSTLAAVAIGWAVALGPAGALFKFSPLAVGPLVSIVVIVIAYIVVAEAVKRWFYRRLAAAF